MKYDYFISYVFKKRFGDWGYGCCYTASDCPISDETILDFCRKIARANKAKNAVILNYKELPTDDNKRKLFYRKRCICDCFTTLPDVERRC